jgi:NAD-dependent dihydropyrimidine dehydrogenase PreA subunit
MKVCPTGALQVNLVESGIEAAGTPVFVPRLGFCQYSCNACGQICPVGAIPALELKEKQTKIIGKAYIDHDRCIAWADHQTCIVCEEMCPLPNKAISLESGEFSSPTGDTMTISLPVVNREVCIGCGICENKCPVAGEAAIRVYTF